MPETKIPHFDVHPSVVYQLGESLITDAVQALIELVKNCYDADATYAKVIIDTEGSTEVKDSIYSSTGGRIIVEDDGYGMCREDIESGWLMISNRKKRAMKIEKKTTPGGRTPLGDKGLGRLGVQRLGENLEIFTKSESESGYHFGFSWLDFQTALTLKDVDIHFNETNYPRRHGTKVIVSDLREINTWIGQNAISKLQQELSRMISPYKKIRDFTIAVSVDGKSLDLFEISDKVRELSPIRYSISFDGGIFSIKGMARLDFFRPEKGADEFARFIESDNGKSFYGFLRNDKRASDLQLRQAQSKRWFVEFQKTLKFDEMDKVERITGNGKIANPGPFEGEIDSFDLGAIAFQNQNVFDRISAYRTHIKELSGIRVYRDGFAIRVDRDWLKLGAQWTSATSYYGLKPDNTLGYIALSARENMDLEETTDREGFKVSPYYNNFYSLLTEFTAFTTRVHTFFGRAASDFRKKKNEQIAQIDSRKTVEEISITIKKSLAQAPSHKKVIKSFQARLESSISESRSVVSKLKSTKEMTPELRNKVTESLSSIQPLIEESRATLGKLSGFLDELSSIENMGQVLEDRVDGLRRQMDDMYETVALGLTAEALSHEVFNVADQLAKRAKNVLAQSQRKNIADKSILTFMEYVNSAISALRKQMSFLSPTLRYVRDQRHDIDLATHLKELDSYYHDKLKKNNISIHIKSTDKPFNIKMNKGKFTQIIDNFVLNSEYWLKEDIAQNRQKSGSIIFEIRRPFLYISDDGSGIDPSVENSLFEPFISAKSKGRGLGLFIVKQLLDSESCSVGILPERNKNKRLYKFQVDLRGAIYD